MKQAGEHDSTMGALFLAYVRSFRGFAGRRIGAAIALVLAGAVLEGIGILAILPIAALFSGEADTRTGRHVLDVMNAAGLTTTPARAATLIGGFIALLALRSIICWKRDVLLRSLSLGFVDHWRRRLFQAMAQARWQTITAIQRTDLENAITTDVARLGGGTDKLLQASANLAMIAIQLVVVLLLSPALLLVVLAMFAAAALFAVPLLGRASRLGQRSTLAARGMHRQLGHFLTGLKLAKLGNAEGRFLMRFDEAIGDLRAQSLAFASSQSAASGLFQFLCGVLICAALLIGLFALKVQLALLAITLVVLARLVGPLLSLSQGAQTYANMLPAFGALRDIAAQLDAGRVDPVAAEVLPPLPARRAGPAGLELRNLSYRHPGQTRALLGDVSLRIDPGALVLLTGPSGAGKTSLVDLISGLLRPDGGELWVDGEPLTGDAALAAWRREIAYLPQDPFLFDLTVRENLLWNGGDRDEAAIWVALETAAAADLVRALPHGLDTRAGERGQALSGGERQRICIARALLARPRLLILDEATNALDRDLEGAIFARLAALRGVMSLLVITHRAESVPAPDRHYRLADGGITER